MEPSSKAATASDRLRAVGLRVTAPRVAVLEAARFEARLTLPQQRRQGEEQRG
jgi:hypothetical protein